MKELTRWTAEPEPNAFRGHNFSFKLPDDKYLTP